jgi:isoleucyl-tRNA synthetase
MKAINDALIKLDNEQINSFETSGKYELPVGEQTVEILISDVEILTEDIPGWLISSVGNLTVALDITISEDLRHEGIARELVNRIQNLRKENQFEVTDKIAVLIEKSNELEIAVQKNFSYICSETLAGTLNLTEQISNHNKTLVELTEDLKTNIIIQKQTS